MWSLPFIVRLSDTSTPWHTRHSHCFLTIFTRIQSPHLPPTLIVAHPPLRLGVIHGHQILPVGDPALLHSLATTMDVDVLISGGTHKFEAYEAHGKFFVNPGSATGAWSSVWPVLADEPAGDAEASKSEGEKEAPAEGKPEKSDEAEKESKDEAKDGDAAPASTEAKAADGDSADTADKDASGGSATIPPSASSKSTASTPAPPKPARKAHPDPTPSFVLLDIQGTTIMSYVYHLVAGEVKVEKIEYRKQAQAQGQGAGAGVASPPGSSFRDESVGAFAGAGGGGVGVDVGGPRW